MNYHQTASPLVSIIIPTYEQNEEALRAALSALSQDYPQLEVIVVDDASPTTQYDEVRSITDPRFRYVRRDDNVGRTENYRKSLRDLATGDWAMVLDGDDFLTDARFISCAIEMAAQDSAIMLVAGRTETRAGTKTLISDHPGPCVIDGQEMLRALPDSRYFFQHLAVLYRRQDALALDFYRSPTISSDWESLYRLAAHGKVAFLDRVAGVWCIHGGNASSSGHQDQMIANLAIWDSIYAEAVRQGLPSPEADRRRVAVKRFIMRQHIPRVAHSIRDFSAYLQALRRHHPSAVMGLIHPPTLVRVALALFGYYGKR